MSTAVLSIFYAKVVVAAILVIVAVLRLRQKQTPNVASIEALRDFNFRTAKRLKPRIFKPIYHISMGKPPAHRTS